MSRVVVLGVGSPFGGDRLGWDTVDILAGSGLPKEGVALCRLDRPGAALLAAMSGAELAVIVDAVRTGATPGTLHRFADPAALPAAASVSSHGLGVGEALALGAALGELPPRVVVLGGEVVPEGSLPSGTASRLAEAVQEEVRSYLEESEASPAGPGSPPGPG